MFEIRARRGNNKAPFLALLAARLNRLRKRSPTYLQRTPAAEGGVDPEVCGTTEKAAEKVHLPRKGDHGG
jgi:hypothetical protein